MVRIGILLKFFTSYPYLNWIFTDSPDVIYIFDVISRYVEANFIILTLWKD